MITGYIDTIEGHINGWVMDTTHPFESIDLDLYIGGAFYQTIRADIERPDLVILNTGYINYGFHLNAPAGARSDEIIFGTANGGYIIQGQNAKRSHLDRRLYHPEIIENLGEKATLEYSGPSVQKDVTISERICRSLNAVRDGFLQDYGPLWGSLVEGRHGDLIKLAEHNNYAGVGEYLAELGRRDLSFGFLGGAMEHAATIENPFYRNAMATVIYDRALSLSEALGCFTVENPEQGPRDTALNTSLETLVEEITAHLGIGDLQPKVGGYWGIKTERGLIHMRILDAIYVSSRIRAIRDFLGIKGVIEIGGGAGFVAHFSSAMHIAPFKIIDIPSVGAVQAYTLREHPGLKLFGEHQEDAKIELAPPWDLAKMPQDKYEFLVNIDSLPEIETQAAVAYLSNARSKGLRYFLSINQESGGIVNGWSQSRVRDLAQQAGGYTLVNRHRDWMRKGYVEELYRIEPL